MEFHEYIPTRLGNLVNTIFERKVSIPLKVSMLPDNTISLIFYLGNKIERAKGKHVDSNFFNPTETFCFLTGLHTEPIYFDMEGLHSIGINMHPSAIKAFWGVPVEAFKDQVMPWEMEGDMAYIEDHIRSLSNFEERAQWIEKYFFSKIMGIDTALPAQLNRLVTQMEQDLIVGKRNSIEDYSGYSKMHTHRIFKDWMGLTPGKLLRFRQFRKALRLMHQTDWSLTRIGQECGLYDQSHFIRVFQEFAAMTPGAYLKNKTPLPGILFMR